MKKIEWNKVTWYSKLLAVVLFVVVFYMGFCLGSQFGEIKAELMLARNSRQANNENLKSKVGIINDVIFFCADKKSVHAIFKTNQTVEIGLSDGRSMTIPQAISASGARYVNKDESFVFWNKGDTAFITEGNPNSPTYKDCVIKK